MYYKISDTTSFRYWPDVGYSHFDKGSRHPLPLTPKEAEIMLLCDGEHDIEANDVVMSLILRNIITPCERGEHSSEWSSLRRYDNRFFPMMNLMITGKCNFNCLHCFNAADNSALMTELSFEEICDILDQAQDCGINALQITGGEPMLHKRFLDIMREIYRRDMTVFTITTNGYFITQNILDELKAIGCHSEMRISFDGLGCHDWMRGFKGAEENALKAIKLCIDNGFSVFINSQVHRRNVHAVMKTAELLNDMGVRYLRLIRTTEVPRWIENAPDASLSLDEYYGSMLEFAKEYIRSNMNMELYIWQYLYVSPKTRSFAMNPVKCPKGEYRDNHFSCQSTNYMIAVTSSGEVIPCNQASGYFMKYGISFGNIHNTHLKEILKSGKFVDMAKMTVGQIRNNSTKCGKCPYFEFCGGGCIMLRLLFSGNEFNFMHEDITKCHFFYNGWYQKVTQALSDYKNLSEIVIP